MYSSRLFPAFALCFLLTACAGAMTKFHSANQNEIGLEAKQQQALAQGGSTLGQQSAAPNLADSTPVARLQSVATRVLTSAAPYCGQQITGTPPHCAYNVVLEKSDDINAYADGKSLHVNEGLIQRMPSDDALAFVVAHELAHNSMNHVAKGQSNILMGALLGTGADLLASSRGYDTGGQLSEFGQHAGLMMYSQDFEKESDYLGTYFLAAAGYNLNGALDAMRALGAYNPEGINAYGRTHPPTAERAVLLNKTIAEIQTKRAGGQPLTPEMRPRK